MFYLWCAECKQINSASSRKCPYDVVSQRMYYAVGCGIVGEHAVVEYTVNGQNNILTVLCN